MSIDQDQLDYSQFVKNEVDTLKFIKGLTSINAVFPSLSNQAELLYYQYSSKKMSDLNFHFRCELEMEIQGRSKRETLIFIEVNLKRNYSESAYTLCMCDNTTEPKEIWRKFHFDYDPQKGNNNSVKKPKYHWQYGGLSTPKIDEHGIPVDSLYSWLEVPRVSSAPVCLALLLDMVFIEFPSEETIRITEDSLWRDLISRNEKKILGDYYNNISNFLNRDHKSNKLLREFIYG